jgi:hypothetical protein
MGTIVLSGPEGEKTKSEDGVDFLGRRVEEVAGHRADSITDLRQVMDLPSYDRICQFN